MFLNLQYLILLIAYRVTGVQIYNTSLRAAMGMYIVKMYPESEKFSLGYIATLFTWKPCSPEQEHETF